jgi:multicomponent K+:H+ antiporter subunit A
MKVPVEVLVVTCLLVGLMPALTVDGLLRAAASSVLQAPLPEYSLALWHGLNLPLLMSAVALVAGVLLYFARRYYFNLHGYRPGVTDGRMLSEGAVAATVRGARRLVEGVASGSLQRYVLLLVLTALGLAVVGAQGIELATLYSTAPAGGLDLLLAAMLGLAAFGTAARHSQRLLAVILVGVVGLVVSLAFVRLSAPDLALTQLLVEIVTVVLLMLAMHFMPAQGVMVSSTSRRLRDLTIAAAVGGGIAALAWVMMTHPHESIAWYYLENAKPGGGGYNVVNVILVDFRGFDTLGEITVLGIAAVAIAALLQGLRLQPPSVDADGRPWSGARYPLMLRVMSRPLLPLALLVSVYLFLRGHNAPGGGFIAGLVTGTAIILQYVAYGSEWARERLSWSFVALIAAGILVAVLTGVGSWLFGAPFLTSTFGHVSWPVIGKFELASAMLFDLGVYLAVVGTVLVIIAKLGRMSGPAGARDGVP